MSSDEIWHIAVSFAPSVPYCRAMPGARGNVYVLEGGSLVFISPVDIPHRSLRSAIVRRPRYRCCNRLHRRTKKDRLALRAAQDIASMVCLPAVHHYHSSSSSPPPAQIGIFSPHDCVGHCRRLETGPGENGYC